MCVVAIWFEGFCFFANGSLTMPYPPLRHGNLFISNLPQATDVADIKSVFEHWGCHGIEGVNFNPGKKTALVKFRSIWDAQWAMKRMNHHPYGRRRQRIIVRPAKNDYMPRQPGLVLPSSRLYVTRRTHGPKEVMAQSDLEVWFSSCGDVQEIKVLKCKEHQARGIIKMASVHQATYAMEQLNGHTPPGHDTRPLVVKFAYHKIAKNKPDTFLSNSQQATLRRGCQRGAAHPAPGLLAEAFAHVETVVGTRDAWSPAGCSTGTCQACFWRSCGTRT